MDDSISRQVVLEQINQWAIGNREYLPTDAMRCLTRRIQDIPPVTPQPKYEDIAKAFQFGLAFGFGEKHEEIDKVIDEIKKVCTPQSKTGRWVKNDRGIPICSHCEKYKYEGIDGSIYDDAWFPNYCPNCGAKMQEVEE